MKPFYSTLITLTKLLRGQTRSLFLEEIAISGPFRTPARPHARPPACTHGSADPSASAGLGHGLAPRATLAWASGTVLMCRLGPSVCATHTGDDPSICAAASLYASLSLSGIATTSLLIFTFDAPTTAAMRQQGRRMAVTLASAPRQRGHHRPQ